MELKPTTVRVNEANIVDFIMVVLGYYDTYSLHVRLDTGQEELKTMYIPSLIKSRLPTARA